MQRSFFRKTFFVFLMLLLFAMTSCGTVSTHVQHSSRTTVTVAPATENPVLSTGVFGLIEMGNPCSQQMSSMCFTPHSAYIRVFGAKKRQVMAFSVDFSGTFAVALPAGTYIFQASITKNATTPPTSATVTVQEGHIESINLVMGPHVLG